MVCAVPSVFIAKYQSEVRRTCLPPSRFILRGGGGGWGRFFCWRSFVQYNKRQKSLHGVSDTSIILKQSRKLVLGY